MSLGRTRSSSMSMISPRNPSVKRISLPSPEHSASPLKMRRSSIDIGDLQNDKAFKKVHTKKVTKTKDDLHKSLMKSLKEKNENAFLKSNASYRGSSDGPAIKGPWTKEEDEMLNRRVNEFGPKKWSEIAESIPGRIGKQCRERWLNHLDPDVKKGEWEPEEDQILVDAQEIHGNKWSTIAKFLDGRSENAVKNRWNSLCNRKLVSKDGSIEFRPSPVLSAKQRQRKANKKDTKDITRESNSVNNSRRMGSEYMGTDYSSSDGEDVFHEKANNSQMFRNNQEVGGFETIINTTLDEDLPFDDVLDLFTTEVDVNDPWKIYDSFEEDTNNNRNNNDDDDQFREEISPLPFSLDDQHEWDFSNINNNNNHDNSNTNNMSKDDEVILNSILFNNNETNDDLLKISSMSIDPEVNNEIEIKKELKKEEEGIQKFSSLKEIHHTSPPKLTYLFKQEGNRLYNKPEGMIHQANQ